jgi:DNA repair exonuclease SbcCD ATPase subunit
MIRFLRTTIVNAGPFPALDIKFKGDSVGVFGRNGRGKTTLLTLMFAALTNNWSRFATVKKGAVYNQAPERAESYVAIEISNGTETATVRRNLRGAGKSELKFRGKTYDDAEEISREIAASFGADKRLMDRFAFIPQDRMYSLLVDTDANRKEALQTLFGTEKCSQLHDLLNNFVNREAPLLLRSPVADETDLQASLGEVERTIASCQAKIDEHRKLLLADASRKSATAVVQTAARVAELERQQSESQQRVQECRRTEAEASGVLGPLAKSLKETQDELAVLGPQAEAAKARLDAWNRVLADQQRRRQAEQRLEAATAEAAALKPPIPPKNLIEAKKLSAAAAQVARWQVEIERLQQLIENFDRTGQTECPTCGTPVSAIEATLDEARKTLPELREKRASLQTRVQTSTAFANALAQHEAKKQRLADAAQAAQAFLAALPADEQEADVDAAALKALIEKRASLQQKEQDLAARHRKAERACEATRGQLSVLQTSLDRLMQEIESQRKAPDLVSRAKRRLEEDRQAATAISNLQGQIAVHQQQAESLAKKIEACRKAKERMANVETMVKVVERVRDAMHWNAVPAEVSRRRMRAAEADIDQSLELFGSPFRLRTTESLAFEAVKPTGIAEPLAQLSTGQRCVAAVSFWDAIGKELGFLALDEPTANLDEDNRAYLAEALASMSAKRHGRRQLFIVTHDQNLRSAFDQVVDLDALCDKEIA